MALSVFGAMLSMVLGVANNPYSVAAVGRVNGDSWNNKRLDFIALGFQIRADCFEYHAVVPSNEATHVFSDDPFGFCISYNFKHIRPLVTVVCRASSSSCGAKWLTGEPTGNDRKVPFKSPPRLSPGFRFINPLAPSDAFGVGNKVGDVAPVLPVWPVLFEDCGWELLPFTENVFDLFVIKYLV